MKHPRWLIAVLILGAALRLAGLGSAELWYDEAFTRLLARLPFDRMVMATAGDTHPPLFYTIEWVLTRLAGESEFVLRLPGVFFSMLSLWAFWGVMHSLSIPQSTARIALAYMALSPFQLYFAQEARMYTLLQFLVLVAVWSVLEGWWGWLTYAGVALLYVHNYGAFYWATLVLLAAWRERRVNAEMLVAFGMPVVAWLPWLYVLLGQMQTVSTGYWIEPVTASQVIYTLDIFLFGVFTRQFVIASILVTVGWIGWALVTPGPRAGIPDDTTMQTILNRIYSMTMRTILYLAAAPFVVAILASVLWKPVYLYRGLIGAAPFVVLLVVVPVMGLRQKWQQLYVAALVVPCLVAGLAGYWADVIGFKSTTLEMIQRVQDAWQPGDIVYSTNDGTWVTWSAYFDQPVYLMPECDQHDRGALSPLTREALTARIVDLDGADHKRAWVLVNLGPPTSECNGDQIEELIQQYKPWGLVKDDELVTSGVWLLDK